MTGGFSLFVDLAGTVGSVRIFSDYDPLNSKLDLFRSDDLIGIGMEADAVRRKLHRG
jgi:hypothetical protein